MISRSQKNMKSLSCFAMDSNNWFRAIAAWSVPALLIILVPAVHADDAIAPVPTGVAASPGSSAAQPGTNQVLAQPQVTPLLSQEGPLAQWGVVSVRPHLSYLLLYGDGIQASLGQPVTTAIQEISPGILLGIGSHWNLDYTPTWTVYSSRAFRDTLDHSATLTGGAGYGDWTFGFSQAYISDSPVLIETGQQTNQQLYSTGLTASGDVGMHMRLDLAINQNIRLADVFSSSREWSTSDFLLYQFTPRLDAGLGFDTGYVNVSKGPDMIYFRPEVRIVWKPADKISISVQGGSERRQFESGGVGAMNNPVYGASLQYKPFESTTLSLGATRDVSASYFADQVTKSTGWSASLQQRLLQQFYLSAIFAHGTTTYVATQNDIVAGRDDQNYEFTLRLSTTLLRRGTVAILYQLSHNSSNMAAYGFSSRQIGLELGYRF
jgi:hypothetical protein